MEEGLVAIVDIHFGNSREADLLAQVVAHYKEAMHISYPKDPHRQQKAQPEDETIPHHQLFVRLT